MFIFSISFLLKCSAPNFVSFSGGSTVPQPNVFEEIEIFHCRPLAPILLSLGVHRFIAGSSAMDSRIYACLFGRLFKMLWLCVAVVGIVLNFASFVFLTYKSLYRNKKMVQLFIMNIIGIIVELSFLYFATYRSFLTGVPTSLHCLLGFQVISFSLDLLQVIILSLLIDCSLAVFFPFKYKIIVTFRRIIFGNLVAMLFLMISLIIYPVMYEVLVRGNAQIVYCNFYIAIPHDFAFFMGIVGLVLLNFNVLLTIIVVIKVIIVLINRRSVTNVSSRTIINSSIKLVARSLCIVIGNFGCLTPIILYTLSFTLGLSHFRSDFFIDISSLLWISIPIWNVLIFFFGDVEIRSYLRNAFSH